MALAGLFLGMIAGSTAASVGFFAFDLSVLVCLAIYSFVGAASVFGIAVLSYVLRNQSSDWSTSGSHETAAG